MKPLKCPKCGKQLTHSVTYDTRIVYNCPKCPTQVVFDGLNKEVY